MEKILRFITENPGNTIRAYRHEENFALGKEDPEKFKDKYDSSSNFVKTFYDLKYGTIEGVNTKYKKAKEILEEKIN